MERFAVAGGDGGCGGVVSPIVVSHHKPDPEASACLTCSIFPAMAESSRALPVMRLMLALSVDISRPNIRPTSLIVPSENSATAQAASVRAKAADLPRCGEQSVSSSMAQIFLTTSNTSRTVGFRSRRICAFSKASSTNRSSPSKRLSNSPP